MSFFLVKLGLYATLWRFCSSWVFRKFWLIYIIKNSCFLQFKNKKFYYSVLYNYKEGKHKKLCFLERIQRKLYWKKQKLLGILNIWKGEEVGWNIKDIRQKWNFSKESINYEFEREEWCVIDIKHKNHATSSSISLVIK